MAAYDPFAPSLLSDPYPTYHWLRDEAPVHLSAVTETFAALEALLPWLVADQDLGGAAADEHIDSCQFRGRKRLVLVRTEG